MKILQYDFVHKSDQNQCQTQEKEALMLETMKNEYLGCEQGSEFYLSKDSILHRLLELQLLTKVKYLSVAKSTIWVNNLSVLIHFQQKTITTVAKNADLSNQPLHSHDSQICDKLFQTDQRTLDAIDYDHLKSIFRLTDAELYEIGATALDCSIMLTIQCAPEHQSNSHSR